ncbi:DUF1016 family protein [Candidatus Saccharibacteria bacterium]|nr:DUF1016 family protein [Candidatus Saccharibacteria bacterium]
MDKISKSDFISVVVGIKNEIRTTQYRTMQQVNSNLIMMYFRIGKILAKNSKYGNSFIKNVSTELTLEFPDLKGFSDRNLRSMKLFYDEYENDIFWQQLAAKLPWWHNMLLIQKIKDLGVRKIYAEAAIENGWSRSRLEEQIRNEYHKRVGAETHNFTRTLAPEDSVLAEQTFKDPYIFDFLTLREKYKEQELERAMVERIRDILLELGKGWSFVGNQYKVTVGKEDYFIDLLFYHTRLKRYIVVELKAGKFEPEFAGKMNFYLSAVNDFVKTPEDGPSIGLILCRDKDGFTAQYSLQDINKPIGVSTFETGKLLPEDIMEQMPTEEDLNLHIDIEEQ